MRKILLIDGNSVLFRAYYGTLSRGIMTSSSGFVTNAVYGFSTMLAKALQTYQPTHILVAFDTKAKTFRHDLFESYKGTRKEVDEDLVAQFSLVREFLDAYAICRLEVEGYEADDIIGTLSRRFADDSVYILTSDRDMLQLISTHTSVLLMKKGITDIKKMDLAALDEEYQIVPSQIVDIKSLMGDASDNIPGVPSVGEKTALRLIHEFENLDQVYQNIDSLKGKLKEKLIEYKEQAYLSHTLASIFCEVNIPVDVDAFVLPVPGDALNAFYRKYDMNSLIIETEPEHFAETKTVAIQELDATWTDVELVMVADIEKGRIQGVFISDSTRYAYVGSEAMKSNLWFKEILSGKKRVIAVFGKELYRLWLELGLDHSLLMDDALLLAFIVNASINTVDQFRDAYELWFKEYEGMNNGCLLAGSIFPVFETLQQRAQDDGVLDVYETIEKKLAPILAQCEYQGIHVDQTVLDDIADKTYTIIDKLSQTIYALAGHEFNLNSPKQLADVLFDELGFPTKKKRSTAIDVLESLRDVHPIIAHILEYRKYQKLYSTYAIGLVKHIGNDQKIHTQFNQHVTQTGRLSSSNPNLQNISIRDSETKAIRKAFVASEGCQLVSIDYSQIELRVLAFLAQEEKMMQAFNEKRDIHVETAKDIFAVDTIDTTMRRQAKTVNFGIIYGMSEYGLAKQLDISFEAARAYIKRYNEVYPNIKKYMNDIVASCERNGYVTTYFNRRRYVPEVHDKNKAVREFGYRAAMNAPIQGTAADIIKLAMIEASRVLRKSNFQSKMILQVHDELLFDVVEEEFDAVVAAMTQVMEQVVDWPVALEVSVSSGSNWYKE